MPMTRPKRRGRRAAIVLAMLLGPGGGAMAQARAPLGQPGGAALADEVATYRRCTAVRAILYPRILAGRDERAMGALLDCLRHRGDTLKTVLSPPQPVPPMLRTHRAQAILSRAATWVRRWTRGAARR